MASTNSVRKTIIPIADLEETTSSPGKRVDLSPEVVIPILQSLREDYIHKNGYAPKFVDETLEQLLEQQNE